MSPFIMTNDAIDLLFEVLILQLAQAKEDFY